MSYRLQTATAEQRQQILAYQSRMFVGYEVEHNANFGKKTLFVQGVRSARDILKLARQYECEHVFFGANYSNPQRFDAQWQAMINEVCEYFSATIDIEPQSIESFQEYGLHLITNLQVQIRLTIPKIDQMLNTRTYVKFDDIKPRSNLTVNVIELETIYKDSKQTYWSAYSLDQYIE
jgi:hypothetical protein